jgi:hypothetical protein
MVHYSHRKHLLHVERAEDDGFLDSAEGLQIVKKNDLLGCDEFGNRFVISEDYFYDNYVPVKKMRVTKTSRKSPFEPAYEEAYKQNWVSLEDEQYINGTYAISKNKD